MVIRCMIGYDTLREHKGRTPLLTWKNLNHNMDTYYIHYEVRGELLVHAQVVEDWNRGWIISSHTLLGMWSLIPAEWD